MADKKTILFIDDNKDFLTLMEEDLESNEYSVKTFLVLAQSEGVAENVKRIKPDLIFLDVMFSKKFSNALATELRQIDELKTVPIYLVSSLDIAEISLIANKKEVNGCFMKPIKRADVAMLFKKHFNIEVSPDED